MDVGCAKQDEGTDPEGRGGAVGGEDAMGVGKS